MPASVSNLSDYTPKPKPPMAAASVGNAEIVILPMIRTGGIIQSFRAQQNEMLIARMTGVLPMPVTAESEADPRNPNTRYEVQLPCDCGCAER